MNGYSYRDQLDVLASIRVKEGQLHRGNCPFCGGKNTFTVTKKNGALIWNCYRASCEARGAKDGLPGIGALQKLNARADPVSVPSSPIPDPLVSVASRTGAMLWLASMHCTEAYENHLIDIRYSPTEDRVMFKVGDEGWIGKGRKGIKPKWKKYGDCDHLMLCGTGSTLVIVEDSCSACAVGILPQYTGGALLGTNITDNLKSEIIAYKSVIICLDPDATSKALQMMKRLSGLTDVTMSQLPDDLKYYDKEQIEGILA